MSASTYRSSLAVASPWINRLRPSIERLRNVQLRDGSLYSNLRTLVPIPVLTILWLWASHWAGTSDAQKFLSQSITVRHLLLAVGVVILWNFLLNLSMYHRRSLRSDAYAEVSRLTLASLACALLLMIGNLTQARFLQGLVLASAIFFGLLLASAALLLAFWVAAALSTRILRRRGAVIIGSGPRAVALRTRLRSHYSQFELYGCIDDEYVGDDTLRHTYLGTISQLETFLKENPVEIVFIGLPMKSKYTEIQRVIQICEAVGAESHYMRDLFETSHARVQAHSQEPHHFTVWSTLNQDPKQFLKRFIDLVGAVLLLILFSPVMLAAAIAVRFSSPGPILFVQQRYGRHRQRFPMFKFRSMVVDAEQRQAALETRNEAQGPVFKLKTDPRITPVGSFLRRTSIDELPQLFNVLLGDMSLVGPRPLPLRDVSRFEDSWLLRRFSVRPGLTCLWQVSGRSNTTFDDWIRQDLTYIDRWSLGLDLKILLLTIPAVLRGSGAM